MAAGEIVGGVIDRGEFLDVADILLLLVGVPEPLTFAGLAVLIYDLEEGLFGILNEEGCLAVEICGLLVYLWFTDSLEVVFLCFLTYFKDDKSKDSTSLDESIMAGFTAAYSVICGKGSPKKSNTYEFK